MTRLLLVSLVAVLWGCPGPDGNPDAGADAGPPDAGPACLQPPDACPSTVPSYSGQVAAIVQNTCLLCHGPGGPGTPPFTSYGDINEDSDVMLGQLAGCVMPPSDAGQLLNESDRAALLAWLVCGAPNN